MTVPTIPRGMQPVVSGYGFGAPDGAMETAVAGGAPRYALDYDRGVQLFSVTLVLESLPFSIWNVFFLQSIKKGAIAFNMPLNSGFGVAMHQVNIVPGSYSVSAVNKFFAVVNFSVRAESQAYSFDDAAAEALIAIYEIYGPLTNAFFDRLDIFATVDTLVLDFGP